MSWILMPACCSYQNPSHGEDRAVELAEHPQVSSAGDAVSTQSIQMKSWVDDPECGGHPPQPWSFLPKRESSSSWPPANLLLRCPARGPCCQICPFDQLA